MKHLMIFDIDNIQEEYSYVMEGITLIQSNQYNEFAILRNNYLKNKFSRTFLEGNRQVPRYFECPREDIINKNSHFNISKRINLDEEYFNILNDSEEKVIENLEKNQYFFKNEKKIKVKIPSTIVARYNASIELKRKDLAEANKENNIYYHIRVNVKNDEIYNLQYLALLLKKYEKLINEERLSVVLISENASLKYYPFCNPQNQEFIENINNDYVLFSKYLRLLAQDNTGVIYAPYFEQVKDSDNYTVTVSPMDFKKTTIKSDFFPIIEIRADEYNQLFNYSKEKSDNTLSSEITANCLFNSDSTKSNKYELFNIGKYHFYNSDAKNPHKALLPYIAETAWNKLQEVWRNNGKFDKQRFAVDRNTIIKRFTETKNNWITFAIFSFILSGYKSKENMTVRINDSYKMARQISSAVQQLIQNSIQHSERKSCFFSFYLNYDNKLNILVSDLNMQNTIIENFKRRLNYEVNLVEENHENNRLFDTLISGYKGLANSNNISLRHFFNVFHNDDSGIYQKDKNDKEMIKLWRDFRCSDSTAHIGLLLFYQTICQCHADLTLQSSKDYHSDNMFNNIFIDTEDMRNKESMIPVEKSNFSDLHVIPGTQYQITIPVDRWYINIPQGEGSISGVQNFSESYSSFAKYLDFNPVNAPYNDGSLSELLNVSINSYTQADEKFKLQLYWTCFWSEFFEKVSNSEKTIYVWRTSKKLNNYFSNLDNCEIFIKGMFASLKSANKSKSPIFLAFINLNSVFLDSLRDICVSLSNKLFGEKIQLYFADKDYKNHTQLLGLDFNDVVFNASQLCIEHGSTLFRYFDTVNSNKIKIESERKSNSNIDVVPFDVIVTADGVNLTTIFEKRISSIIEERLDKEGTNGYKLCDSHTRLGNKVHIHSFYELSFLFYRTTISNRVAFSILRLYLNNIKDMIDKPSFLLKPMLYYSYASYSKAILTSIVEITRSFIDIYIREFVEYNETLQKKYKDNMDLLENIIDNAQSQVAFASYQHNLQSESKSDSVQLYFGVSTNFTGGKLNISKKGLGVVLDLHDDVDVIQIVPISSSMSTFDKMFQKIKNHTVFNNYQLNLSANYTALWVCDETNFLNRKGENELCPSTIEEHYWMSTNLKNRRISVNVDNLTELSDCPYIYYFLQKKSIWEHPISCSLCFPKENELIREVPLVETDLTSTVPSQQIREEKFNERGTEQEYDLKFLRTNNQRLMWLKDYVYYGHIKRSKNHHQYYISSQDYFYNYNVQEDIKIWLKNIGDEENFSPKLKIIFSPEHNTNVGFAQYVNTYYFGGTAEIVSINEDKVFRSNFICEHKMLRQMIERLHIQNDIFDNEPAEFYFVDDSINTGTTIHKANSLLRSLLPREYVDKYPTYLFKKCFILIDRISNASKLSYVRSGKLSDFYSYVHIDISNMRVQGDSCVGCKLKKDAMKLFKRSASKLTANYWANKYYHLLPVEYDDVDNMKTLKEDKLAYERLILSHIAQNYIFNDGIRTRQIGEYYDCILFFFNTILNYQKQPKSRKKFNNHFKYDSLIEDLLNGDNLNSRKLIITELLLKLLSRPFFSFDYSFRIQIQSLVLIIAECYLRTYSDDPNKIIEHFSDNKNDDWKSNVKLLYDMIPKDEKHKAFLKENKRLEKTIEIIKSLMELHNNSPKSLANFFKNTLFEAIADLRSTYLLRKSVIVKVDKFVKKYLSDDCLECNQHECNCTYLNDYTQCTHKQDYCFWISYFALVQRIIDCSNDEIRAVWFKYLVLTGEELDNNNHSEIVDFIYSNKLGISKSLSNESIPIAPELLLTTATTEFDITEKICNNMSDTKHFFSNYKSTRTLMGQINEFNEETENWFNLLPSEKSNPKSINNDINKRYNDFLKTMIEYISKLTSTDINIFNIALLTMSNDVPKASIDNIQLVNEYFGKQTLENNDIKQSRYIIKDRVVSAYNCTDCNSNTVGLLKNNGYQIAFSDSQINNKDYEEEQSTIIYDINHHVSGNHRKPYIIIEFDNPVKDDCSYIQNNELGRKLVKLSHVFLYISMVPNNLQNRNFLPWIVLHTILSYRNRILRFLSEDFNGDIMEKHAVSLQEEAILTHERSASHASTTDEKGVLRVFGLENVSKLKYVNYPIELNTKRINSEADKVNYYYSSTLWLLLQNYVNNQIARLFSRHFNIHDSNLIINDGIPALYISKIDEQKDDAFKHCLVEFKDINIKTVYDKGDFQDNRFELLNQVSNILCYVEPFEKCYYCNDKDRRFYNAEYVRCIILDIMLTSLKYATVDKTLLPRIDNLLKYRYKDVGRVKSHIIMFKDSNQLVIINNVKSNRISKERIDFYNEEIFRRIHDPLDYGDGHMSLYTIRSFILGIESDNRNSLNNKDTEFKYVTKESISKRYNDRTFYKENYGIINNCNIWFETRLPIFKEEKKFEKNNYLDR
ncbi:MAG: hypothetical protein ACLUFN_07415 [Eubacterium sp.]